ncbi:MAG: hypothetical protein K2X90_00605 [Candidatus Babeliaceae bacterium]|nr:hypothetical protein [Candidatus Babeliaceae bacterium]
MKKRFSFHLTMGLIGIVLISACAKRPSTPDQALTHAQETYNTMKMRYSKLISLKPMSAEALQELRVLGVHRDRTGFELFYDILFLNWFSWNTRKSTPIFRMEEILKSDLNDMAYALKGLRNFSLEKHPLYIKLADIHNKILYIKEQLPVQKEYIDENNTRVTHAMLTTIQTGKY